MLPWIIWVLSALFVVLNYVQQVFPNVASQELERAFHADSGMLGTLASAYFYAYAILQIPVGLILDRFGTRRPLVIAIMTAGISTVGFAFAHTESHALLARLLMGAGSAFSFLGCLKLVQEWFPVSRFSTMAGMTNTAAMLGAACGAPLAILVNSLGWRATMTWTGGIELILALLVLIIVRDRPRIRTEADNPSAKVSSSLSLREMIALLRNGMVWINAIYATCISLIFVAFGGLWGSGYIQKVYALDAVAAAGTSSILFLGGIAGSLFYGWYSDHLQSRRKPMVQAGIGGLLTIALLLYVPGIPLSLFKVGLFLAGFFSSANIISYAVARDLFPRLSGLSIGFLSTCYYVGNATSEPLVGLLLGRHAPAGGGMNSVTLGDYRFALSSLVLFMGVALICSLLLRETLPGENSHNLKPN
ncbi:MAG: MFS transporter [bacterium]